MEILLVVIVVFILIIFGYFVYEPFKQIATNFQTMNSFGNATASTVSNINSFGSLWDNSIMFFFLASWMFLLISAWYLNTSPMFFVIMLILMTVAVFAIILLANAYSDFHDRTNISTDFPLTDWMLTHIVETIFLVIITTFIVLFGRKDAGRGGTL